MNKIFRITSALAIAMAGIDQRPALPSKLDARTDPPEYLKKFDVFFNGEKQRLCLIADASKGEILRYKHGIGSMPVRARSGKYETEHLKGKVEIKLKAPESV